MKKIFLILISVCLLLALAACDGGENIDNLPTGTPTDAPTEAPTEAPEGINESEWNEMLSDEVFENYTVIMDGKMTVTTNGIVEVEDELVKERIKVACDKMSIEIFVDGEFSEPMVFDGELAESQKIQSSQLFMLLLDKYDSFVYDKDAKVYIVEETITIDAVLKGMSFMEDGSVAEFDVPAVIEMKDAEVRISDDGKLASFTCDYTQTMEMGEGYTVSTSGLTTWTFSDFGTTVIEEASSDLA